MRETLKKDEFEHLLKKMDYDRKVFEIWKQKVATVQGSRMHAKQEHLVSEHRRLSDSVENYIDGCFRFLNWETCKTSDSLIPQILSYRMEALKKIRSAPASCSDVPTVVLMNWTAPCLLASTRQKDHANILAWALHDNCQSVGVVFFPTFSYKKGKTYLEEHLALSTLTSGGHNLDHQFSLLYSERSDQRDSRPLLYPARFAFPGHLLDLGKSNMFFQSDLRKAGRTDFVKQIPPKDLKEVEDVSEDAVPTSISGAFVQGAAKRCQLGQPAAEEVLRKLFAGVDLDQVPAIVVVDLFPRVGDFCQAFAKLRSTMNSGASMFYVAVGEKSKELDWLRLSLNDELVEKVKAGSLTIPGMQKAFAPDLAADLLEALPAPPIMNLLVTQGEGEFRKLVIPKALVQKWAADPDFGQDFTTWLDNFLETYAIGEDSAEPVSNKRAGDQAGAGQGAADPLPSPKKAKVVEVDPAFILENDKIQETLLMEAKLGNKDSLNFQVRSGHCIYLVNLTGSEQTLKGMTTLVGFGRGGFKLFKEQETIPDRVVCFDVTSPDMLVCLNGTVATVSEVLAKQRESKPEAEVCYHKASIIPEKPGSFNFHRKQMIAFVPNGPSQRLEEENKEATKEEAISCSNIGCREPVATYSKLTNAQIIWTVKWTIKGLQPVKPQLHLLKKVCLPVGKSCKL